MRKGILPLATGDHHNQERDEHDDAVQVILGTKQVIDRFLTAHKTIQIVALKDITCPRVMILKMAKLYMQIKFIIPVPSFLHP